MIFEEMGSHNHEQLVFGYDREIGLRAIIAIHNTALGPALGGTRMWPYASFEEALRDALRLSRGMTYKSAAAGLNLGGGKAVIIGDPDRDKSELLFRDYGRLVEGLGGRYITAEDVGVGVAEMEWVRAETSYVVGLSESIGGSGDPSPVTARGVFFAIKACVEEVFGSGSLSGVKVAVQGLGHVGMRLAEQLREAGADLFVTDLHEERVVRAVDVLAATPVARDEIYDVGAEIFAPCALGAVINDDTLPRMRFKIVAGAANNQLADEDRHGLALKERGILYAPDYVANAGGLINVANEIEGYNRERALSQVETIYAATRELIRVARAEDIPTHVASNRVAERRIEAVGGLRRKFVNTPMIAYRNSRVFPHSHRGQ